MIFDKPDLSLREGETAARPTPAYTGEASWLNAAIANHDDILTSWNHIAGQNASEEAYDAYIDRVKAATGEQMENPWRTTGLPVVVPGKVHSFGLPSFTIASTGALKENAYAAFDTRRKELAAKYPEHASLIAANRPMSDFSRELVLQNRERSDAENAKLGGWAWTAQLAGGLVAGLQDPVNLATMGFGFGAGTGAREIILAGVKAGAINAATEVASYSAIKDWRERAGLDYSTSELAMGAASAFLLGFGVDAGGRALWRAGRGRLGYEPVVDNGQPRSLAAPSETGWDRPGPVTDTTTRGIVTGYRKPEQSLDDAVKDLPADHVVRRAYDGDNAALREVAEQTGAINNPAVKGALDFEMLNDLRPSKVDGVEPWEFESRSLQALRAATDDDEPPPVRLASVVPQQARELDALGFYSKALEAARALRQAKGTPEQMRAQLRSAGVKEAEIQAVGLDGFLEGKASVTRDEIVSHIEQSRVDVREASYDRGPVLGGDEVWRGTYEGTKWSSYSIDPSNPTYRETVLHLPASRSLEEFAADSGLTLTPASRRSIEASYGMDSAKDFRSGHWDEPNVIAHARTSIQKDAQGRKVFVVNELQSDWGQTLRETGGGRSQAKVDALRTALKSAEEKHPPQWVVQGFGERKAFETRADAHAWMLSKAPQSRGMFAKKPTVVTDQPLGSGSAVADFLRVPGENYLDVRAYPEMHAEVRRLNAELRTLEHAPSDHPLVNTTDQWVDLGLKRVIRQAVDADADQIAIPSGETVKALGMGGEESGIRYAYDQMYPKNLRNLLRKFDKGAEGRRIDHLFGQRGEKLERSHGFTTFELTPEIKRAVRSEGMTLFSLPQIPDGTPPPVAKLVDELVADPAQHAAVIRELADAKPQSVAEARKVVGEYLARGREAETQRTYLGARTNPDDTEPLLSRAGLSEPNGPEAKAMVDALERDLAPQQKPTTSKELPRGRTAYDAAVAEGRYVHTETADARVAEIRAEVARTVAMLPPDVQLRVQDNLIDFGYGRTAQGAWDGYDRIVYVSLAAADPVRVARHETVHALRQSGLMSDAEFDTLYKFAESEGLRAAYKIDENYKDLYGKAYGDRGEAFVEALLREETIADMFADYSLNGRRFANEFGAQGRVIDQIMQLIVDFLKAVRDAVGVHGLKDVRDVFEAIESGAMAQRGSKVTLPDGSEIEGFHLFSIRAFHGTPHTFEPEPGAPAGRFRSDKINTGEGAQAFGHGLYFAESEGVAHMYRDALSDTRASSNTLVDGVPVNRSALPWLTAFAGDADSASSIIPLLRQNIEAESRRAEELYRLSKVAPKSQRGWARTQGDIASENASSSRRNLDKLTEYLAGNPGRISRQSPGRIYEVRIDAEPDQFLDWDKPLAAQVPAVRTAIESDPAFVAPLSDAPDNFMRNAVRDAATAAALRDAGVVGVRYLDGNSRGAGEGTSNFVIFPGNEHLIEIVAVDGKPVASLAADLADAKHDGTMGKIVEACRL